MEKEFSTLKREKSGQKGENFNQMYRVIMMFKAWFRGTHHSVTAPQPYINEYTFRFNRHKMTGGIFENLVVRILSEQPYPYRVFIY